MIAQTTEKELIPSICILLPFAFRTALSEVSQVKQGCDDLFCK